jgi:hypothetical protein
MAAVATLIALEAGGHKPAHAHGHCSGDSGTHRARAPSPMQPHIAPRSRRAAGTQAGRDPSGTGSRCGR